MSKLCFRLEGPSAENGRIDARDLASFLGSLLDCLEQVRKGSAESVPVDYPVVGLSPGSATVEIELRSGKDEGKSARVVATRFEAGFRALEKREIHRASFDMRTRQSFINLTKTLSKSVHWIYLTGTQTHRLGLADRVKSNPGSKSPGQSIGSVSGRVEALDVRGAPFFRLYPPTSSNGIKCSFRRSLWKQVLGSVQHYTTVHGVMRYEIDGLWPTHVRVDQIDVHPPEDQLPGLADLFGAAPDLTGGIESAAYIRALRDADT